MAHFLRQLLRHGARTWVLLHEQTSMHKSEPLWDLYRDSTRPEAHWSQPYAPEPNPVEYLWDFTKDNKRSNFAPHNVPDLDAKVQDCLQEIRHDQQRMPILRQHSATMERTASILLTINKHR